MLGILVRRGELSLWAQKQLVMANWVRMHIFKMGRELKYNVKPINQVI